MNPATKRGGETERFLKRLGDRAFWKSIGGNVMATEQRAPYPRSADNADKMNLPEGKTCGDCAHCRRCTMMFGHIPEDESCDWSPSRFTPVKVTA
jgi:hypothetical protein